MIISLWNLLQYHSCARWAIQAQRAQPLVYGKFYVHDFLLIIDYGINIDIVSVFNIISHSYSTCRQGIKKGHNSKLYRKLYTAVQSSPIIRNLTGQFALSKFKLKEARIRPKLCRHKMLTWLSLRVIYARMAVQSYKYEKPTKFESVKKMANLWPTCFSILLSSWIVSLSQSVKYWYKVCTESQLTVLKRCMETQAAFLWKHKNNNTFVDNQTIFNRLDDKRNWISEWAKIEKSIPENLLRN
jgi:hypothetical protein